MKKAILCSYISFITTLSFYSHPDPIIMRPPCMTHGLLYFVNTRFDLYNINQFIIVFLCLKLFWSCLCCIVLVKCFLLFLVQVCTSIYLSIYLRGVWKRSVFFSKVCGASFLSHETVPLKHSVIMVYKVMWRNLIPKHLQMA